MLLLAACGQEVTIDMVAHAMPGISRNLERSFGHPVVVARDGFPVYVGVGETPDGELGHWDGYGDHAVINISPRIGTYNTVPSLLLHELGHAMGLKHEPSGIMRAEAETLDPYVAAEQLAELCRHHACTQPLLVKVAR